jgi:hypothetical protein
MGWPLLILVAVIVGGCGQAQHVAATASGTGEASTFKRDPRRSCSAIVNSPEYRTCFTAAVDAKPTIERRTRSGWRVVAGSMRPHEPSAQWYGGWLSRDGQTLLVDWQFPCDYSVAVFVRASGGEPGLVTGETDWRKAPIARSLGWTRGGKARVRLYTSWKRWHIEPRRPRIFAFDPQKPASDARPVVQRAC